MKAAFRALNPGGKFFIWLYAKEGTKSYRQLVIPLREISKRLPPSILSLISWFLALILSMYVLLCKNYQKLPLSSYMIEVIDKVSLKARMMTIYDQLNPIWVKYYSKSEVEDMMKASGFTNVNFYHRHGYSWSVIGTFDFAPK